MSKSTFNTARLNDVLQQLETTVREHENLIPSNVVKGTYSAEGHAEFNDHINASGNDLRYSIQNAISALNDEFGNSMESTDPNYDPSYDTVTAGIIAAIGSQDAKSYSRAALKYNDAGMQSLESIDTGVGGSLTTITDHDFSAEAFDVSELANFVADNIVFNVMAARQDEFAEGFFPTKVITAADGGLEAVVDRQEVIEYSLHKTDGSLIDLNRRNLIGAFKDPSILDDQSTEVVPHARDDDSNADSFIDATLVPNILKDVGKTTIQTRPLTVGKRINLLGISQEAGQLDNGQLDHTDALAAGMKLSTLYMTLTDSTADTDEVLKIGVSDMPRVQFRQSYEGRGREVALQFLTDALPLSTDTKTVGGSSSTLLTDELITPDLYAQLKVTVNGHGSLEEGWVEIHPSSIQVDSVYDATGEKLPLDSGAGKTLVDRLDTLNARINGIDLSARRVNNNWRTTGSLIDVTPYRESYAISPGYPITVLTPTDEQQHGAKISGMINAARVRNSNNAVATLFNYADQLRAFKEAAARGAEVDIIGISRYIVTPYYNEFDLDLDNRIDSIRSQDRYQDVQRVLVDAVRQEFYEMYRESNYGPALELGTGGAETMPIGLIGTDSVLRRYLYVSDSEKLLTDGFKSKVVETNNDLMSNTIFLTFTRERPGTEDGLGFGTHAYMPELIQEVTTNRNGSTAKNNRVIPRQRHIPALPILAKINVVNLKLALSNTSAE